MHSLSLELRRIAREVLMALAADDGAPVDAPPQQLPAARLACCVRIDGEFRGEVLVHASVGLAVQVARRMFGREPDSPFAAETQEALREITNIVAGHVKSLLGFGNHLDLPEDLPLDAPYPDLPPVAEAEIDHQGERLEIRIFAEP